MLLGNSVPYDGIFVFKYEIYNVILQNTNSKRTSDIYKPMQINLLAVQQPRRPYLTALSHDTEVRASWQQEVPWVVHPTWRHRPDPRLSGLVLRRVEYVSAASKRRDDPVTVVVVQRHQHLLNFILKTNRPTAVWITNRATIYVMQCVMMDKKHNMNNNNNKS